MSLLVKGMSLSSKHPRIIRSLPKRQVACFGKNMEQRRGYPCFTWVTRFLGKARFAAQVALAIFMTAASTVRAQHHAIVEWYADLAEPTAAAPGNTSVARSNDIGRATVTVDFTHQTVTFHTVIKNLLGLRRIEVRADSVPGNSKRTGGFYPLRCARRALRRGSDAHGRRACVFNGDSPYSQQQRRNLHCDRRASRR